MGNSTSAQNYDELPTVNYFGVLQNLPDTPRSGKTVCLGLTLDQLANYSATS